MQAWLSGQHSDSAPVDNTTTRAFLLDRASVMWCPPAGARNPADWFLSSITGVSHATCCETRIADVPQISCCMRQQSILLASGNCQDVIRPICVRTSPCRKNQDTGNFRLDAAAASPRKFLYEASDKNDEQCKGFPPRTAYSQSSNYPANKAIWAKNSSLYAITPWILLSNPLELCIQTC